MKSSCLGNFLKPHCSEFISPPSPRHRQTCLRLLMIHRQKKRAVSNIYILIHNLFRGQATYLETNLKSDSWILTHPLDQYLPHVHVLSLCPRHCHAQSVHSIVPDLQR